MYSVTAKLIATGKNIVNDRRRSFSVILIARPGSSGAKETAEREGGARVWRLGSMCVVWEPRRGRPTTEGLQRRARRLHEHQRYEISNRHSAQRRSTIACESNRLADHVACGIARGNRRCRGRYSHTEFVAPNSLISHRQVESWREVRVGSSAGRRPLGGPPRGAFLL
jgi:hypothetical protein